MSADPHAIPDDPIAYWEALGFHVTWGSPQFGQPLSLCLCQKELDICFVGEGHDADEVYEDAWRWYVAHHIESVTAWAEAKERTDKQNAFDSQERWLRQQEREQVRSGWSHRRPR